MKDQLFRANLELLNELYPARVYLTVAEVMQLFGYKSRNSVYSNFSVKHGRIFKTHVAHEMC